MKRIWPSRAWRARRACGSFTLTIISAAANTSSARGTIVAPAFRPDGVRRPDAASRALLDRDGVTVRHHFADRRRRQSHPVFMVLYFLGYANQHVILQLRNSPLNDSFVHCGTGRVGLLYIEVEPQHSLIAKRGCPEFL